MKVLIAGIGNIFMGDDAFGCEVANTLYRDGCPSPPDTQLDIVDFGIRGMDLSYALTDGYDLAVLIDTVDQGDTPGTLYVIEPEIDDSDVEVLESGEHVVAPHEMDPVKVLRFAATLGGTLPRVLLVGCQPEFMGGEDGFMGLSKAVTTAVDEAASEVRSLLQTAFSGEQTRSMEQPRLSA